MPDPTAEQLARESGAAMANAVAGGLERVIMRLVEEIATLKVEQAELRDSILTLSEKGTRHELQLDEHRRIMRALHDDLGRPWPSSP